MYQTHWELRETPFRTCLDPRFFYQSPAHEEALARLHFLVDQHRRLGVLLGEPGSGKSLLLEVFAAETRRQGRAVAKVNLLGLTPAELLWELAASFGLNLAPAEPPASLWRCLLDRLAEHRYEQRATVVLLDDADQAASDVLAGLRRLASLDYSPESRLTIVLAGCPKRIRRLGRSLLEMAELRIDVAPWEASDTEDYVRRSLARAGRDRPVFDEPAVQRLHELTHGIPRRVSQLADLALLAGAGRQLDHVDAEVVETVFHELGVIEV